MENTIKYCNPCAPIAKAQIGTETAEPIAKTPTTINVNGDYVLYGALILILYQLLKSLFSPKKRRYQFPEAGISQFIQRTGFEETADKKYCSPPNSTVHLGADKIQGTPWMR